MCSSCAEVTCVQASKHVNVFVNDSNSKTSVEVGREAE